MSDDHVGRAEALGLGEPWRVSDAEFDEDTGRLDLHVDYPRGTRFACPEP